MAPMVHIPTFDLPQLALFALDRVSDAIYWVDNEGRFFYVNKAASRLLGYTQGELLRLSVFDIDPNFLPETWEAHWQDLKEAGSLSFESSEITKDGKVIHTEVMANFLRYAGQEYNCAVVRDITARKKAEHELGLMKTAVEKSSTSFFRLSPTGKVMYVNNHACISLGYSREELVGRCVWEFDPDFPAEAWAPMWEALKKDGVVYIESQHQRKDGTIFPVEITGNYIYADGEEYTFVFVQDISTRKLAEENIRKLAHYDALTGLPNRTLLYDRMSQLIAWSHRDQQKFSVLFLDLDRFKYVNDSMGHAVGDKLLQHVADRLKTSVREGDTISRIGGDEFLVLLRDTDAQGAALVANKLLQTLQATYSIDGLEVFTHASIGISIYPDNAEDADQLIKYADTAMYRAKEEGRNNFQFFGAEMNLHSTQLFAMEKDLRLAMARNEFSLHYQAQADLKTGQICGAEALLRWKHPEKGFISPVDFIPVAEDTGMIIPIGEWVLRTACAQIAEMRKLGLPAFTVSVNLSIRQLRLPNLSTVVANIIRDSGLQPHDLELEITEGIMMTHVQSSVAFLEEMRKLGVQLAIDDFGTGFSSLSYLKKLPVTKLKIDKSFVRDILTDENDAAIVRSIIGLGHQFKLKVISEGTETREQLEFLRVNGCDEIQGYYFSRPLPADQFFNFVTSHGGLGL
ncbi:MAG TPA: EAL domain-containing protein [Methylophilaceae bacterium]|nr:EAL domain-containing protein [Methylophilaceae bacterium]